MWSWLKQKRLPREVSLDGLKAKKLVDIPGAEVRRTSRFRLILDGDDESNQRLEHITEVPDYRSADCVFYDVGSAFVDATTGLALTRRGRPIAESLAVAKHFLKGGVPPEPRAVTHAPAQEVKEPVVHLLHSSVVYGHFVLDMLVAALLLRDRFHAGEMKLLMPAYVAGWARDILAAVGIGPEYYVYADGLVRAEHLISTNLLTTVNTFRPSREALKVLRGLAPASVGKRRKLYLYRPPGGSDRRIVNEADVQAHLAARGFEIIDPTKLSFHQQMQAAADAAVVVSAHGSGLANLCFARPGTLLVDLMPDKWVGNWDTSGTAERWGLNLTTALDQDYTLLLCRSEMRGLPMHVDLAPNTMLSKVDIDHLDQALAPY